MPRFTPHALLPLTLPLLLLACGQNPTPAAVQEDLGPYANGASYPWSYTQPAGTVTPLVLDPGANNLYYEPILSATNGWGPIEVNRSNGEQQVGDGRPLTVAGKTYDVGYGVHADSELRWSLKSTLAGVMCNKLDGYVGMDDEVGDRGSVTFQIWLDGAKVWDSGVMTGKDGARFYSVDTTGKTDLRLVVTNGGDNFYYDHADWIQPTVHCAQGSTTTPPPAPGGPSGTIDPTFHTINAGFTRVSTTAVQPDGKIIVAGTILTAGGLDVAFARYNPDGTPDTGFGQAGRTTLHLGSSSGPLRVSLLPDGRIVAVASSDYTRNPVPDYDQFAIIRLLPDGSPDPTANTPNPGDAKGAILISSLPSAVNALYDAVAQSDGKIIVVGESFHPSSPTTDMSKDLFVARLMPDGALDPTFGQGGTVIVPASDGSGDPDFVSQKITGTRVLLYPDGRVLVGAVDKYTQSGYNTSSQLVVRLLPNGTLDSTLDGDGMVTTLNARYQLLQLSDLALLPDGRFLVLGRSTNSALPCELRRFNPDGSPAFDATHFGLIPGPTGEGTHCNNARMAVQADGKVLFTSTETADSTDSTLVGRLNADGTLDKTFGGGFVKVPNANEVLVQPNGRIVVGTTVVTGLNP
ncbi:NPCBM/NEW2 domain-containing protein [Deinococcus pimensis]|uniref:NPCBM/NEW2 domain-containing protein n=1 Tax=Deinococcus pimensis TaxID=309888 RepID=UPI0004B22B16|nr:NPCBM/NEW2 domain-containing protein [Deinococcus pimensis]